MDLFGWLHLDLVTTIWTTLVLTVTLLAAVVIERWWEMGKLGRLGYTGPPKSFILGNLKHISMLNSNFQDGWKDLINKYGSQVGTAKGKSMWLYTGRKAGVVVTNPDVIKYLGIRNFDNFRNRPSLALRKSKTLLLLRDDRWRSVRHTLTPTFSQAKMKLMSQTINGAVSVTLEIIEDHVKQNKPIDFYGIYHGLTLEVIGKCALAIDVDSQRNPDHPLLENCKEAFETFQANNFDRVISFLFPSLVMVFQKYLRRFSTAASVTDSLMKDVLKVIVNRINNKTGRTVDALQLMLEAAQLVTSEETEKKTQQKSNSNGIINNSTYTNADTINGKLSGGERGQIAERLNKKEPKMTEDEVASNATVFLLAGYETTSTMLSYTTYLLAKHQDVQQRLYEEIVQHLNGEDEVTYDMISELEYLDMVVNESLRFYPPLAGSFVSRDVEEDCEFEGMKFPAGSSVIFPVAYMHYNEELWPNPKQFDPERFHPSKKKDIHIASFLPFGLGPRNCIGFRFALMEGKIALARLLRRYCIKTCELTEEVIKTKAANISLTPESGHIYLTCVNR